MNIRKKKEEILTSHGKYQTTRKGKINETRKTNRFARLIRKKKVILFQMSRCDFKILLKDPN